MFEAAQNKTNALLRETHVQEWLLHACKNWGLSLSYALTKSFEETERLLPECVVGFATAYAVKARADIIRKDFLVENSQAQMAVRLAKMIIQASMSKLYHGHTEDSFYRLSYIARAVCILKMKASFSNEQIATVLNLEASQVDFHLESARLIYSDGRSWLGVSPTIYFKDNWSVDSVSTDSWQPECPYWAGTAPRSDRDRAEIGQMFAQYIHGDIEPSLSGVLHQHFSVCIACRSNLARFKEIHTKWAGSIPSIMPSKGLERELERFVKKVSDYTSEFRPSFFAGISSMFDKKSAQFAAFVFVLTLFLLIKK